MIFMTWGQEANFVLKENSAALKFGFKPIDMADVWNCKKPERDILTICQVD